MVHKRSKDGLEELVQTAVDDIDFSVYMQEPIESIPNKNSVSSADININVAESDVEDMKNFGGASGE